VRGADRGQRLERPRTDLQRRGAQVLEPKGDLVRHPREDDLVLGILEEGRNGSGQVGRAAVACVEPADPYATGEAPAVEVRHEPGERAQQRRLPAAGRTEQSHDLARLELERHVAQRLMRLRVGVRQVLDAR